MAVGSGIKRGVILRTLRKNKQKMYYALQAGEVPIYETDEYGNIIYTDDGTPIETGEYEIGYASPVEFYGNIAMSGGESEAVEYGIDVSAYDATLVVEKGTLPIDESSLIWFESEVGFKDAAGTITDGDTADYNVLSIKPSLNVSKYILGRINK